MWIKVSGSRAIGALSESIESGKLAVTQNSKPRPRKPQKRAHKNSRKFKIKGPATRRHHRHASTPWLFGIYQLFERQNFLHRLGAENGQFSFVSPNYNRALPPRFFAGRH